MPRFSSPAVPGNQRLPPPPLKQQITASIRQRGDGSSLAHIWQETWLSKGKASVQTNLTINFCRAGQGNTPTAPFQIGQNTHTGTNVFLVGNRHLSLKCQKGPCNGLLQRSLISAQRQKGPAHKHTLKICHFSHKNSKSQVWVSTCKGYIC